MKISDIKIGKRFRKSLGDIDSLVASIEQVGLLHPIVVDGDNNLIVGYRRVKAFEKLGRTEIPHTIAKTLRDALKTLAERDENNCREDFTPEEKLSLADALEDIEKKDAEKRRLEGQRKGGKTSGRWNKKSLERNFRSSDKKSKKTKDIVAKSIGWSGRTLEKAQEIDKVAKENPTLYGDLLGEMNKSGKVDGAYREYKKRKKLHETNMKIEEISTKSSEFSDRISVCPIESISLPNNSIDMIFTDPPYHDEHINLYDKLGELARQSLKPGAYCVVYCGKMFLPEIINAMSRHLEYVWTFAVFHSYSKTKINKHHIFENWRPIVAFKKEGKTRTREWVQDVVRPEHRNKEFHEWQQDIESPVQYISAYTKPGEIVLDPFVGGGATPTACLTIGRNFMGFDKDERAIKATIARLKETKI